MAGIGKSRLVQALQSPRTPRALSPGRRAVRANLPYGALTEPVRDSCGELLREPAALSSLAHRVWAMRWARRAWSPTSSPSCGCCWGSHRRPGGGAGRQREPIGLTLQALVQALRGSAAGAVLDDLQWADPESLALIERLVASDARHLLLLVVSPR